MSRRDALAMTSVGLSVLPVLGCNRGVLDDDSPAATTSKVQSSKDNERSMQVHYLEIVTKNVDATCQLYSELHGVTFSDADASLGGARTTQTSGGGMVGVRAPMHDGENPVTRAYVLVSDIEASVATASKAGAEIAVPPMQIPGHGTCAIYIQDGIEAGLWQL